MAEKEKLIIPCKFCNGQGFILIKNGEDTCDCPRCQGSGKEK